MEDTLEKIRKWLGRYASSYLDKSRDDAGIFEAVDSFVELSQGNTSVREVFVWPYDEDVGNYELWDKVGQGVGNLKSLKSLGITLDNEGDGSEPDWEILARVLRHVSHDINLKFGYGHIRGTEEMRAFARAIQGQPAIAKFVIPGSFRFESTDVLCAALATLPNLQSVVLRHAQVGREEELELGRPESMSELLRAPSLRSVTFGHFCFTNALCEATANALKEGAVITTLVFDQCYFPEGGSEKIASALKRNTTLNTFKIGSVSMNEAFYDALAAALLSNSMLQELIIWNTELITYHRGVWVASLFLALGMNTTLKNLHISGFDFAGELCSALQDGLGKNSTLEKLELADVNLAGADVTEFSFYFVVIKAVQPNTLKTLRISNRTPESTRTYDEVKNLTSLVKQNYGLESLPGIDTGERMRDLRAILKLNRAGRRCMSEDGSSIAKGVDLLSAVSDDLDCVFLHLLENPTTFFVGGGQ